MRRRRLLIAGFALAGLLLAACSLAGDVTPPPGFEQPTGPPPVSVVDVGYPATAPSVAEGARLYAENCTRCHGVTGGGDGEMASQIQFPIPAFATPDFARGTTPARWFSIITNGNLERLMPPWSGKFTEAQRWSLGAYLYTLSTPKSQIETGQTVYTANCASCHGESGQGNGPKASGQLPDFTDQKYMTAKSNTEFFDSLLKTPHDFASLAEDERWAVINYVRVFSFSTEELSAADTTGAITGKLTNGTAVAAVPADLPVVLRAFDNFTLTETLTTTVKSDGTFAFTNVDLPSGRAFLVSAEYGGIVFTSDIAQVAPGQTTYELPFQIFETTTDPASIRVDHLNIAFDFRSGAAQVVEQFIISNQGDKAYVSAAAGGPTFSAALPAGYTGLTFQDGELGNRYQQTADGFADTDAVRPGMASHQILLSFTLPYTDALAFAQTMSYPTSTVNVLLPANQATLTGSDFSDGGVRQAQGRQLQTYTTNPLQAGQTLEFELKGGALSASSPIVSGNITNLVVGALLLAVVIAGTAFWWVSRTRGRPEGDPVRRAPRPLNSNRVDHLLDELASLDLAFEAGQQPEADYRARRAKLKTKLKALLNNRQTTSDKVAN